MATKPEWLNELTDPREVSLIHEGAVTPGGKKRRRTSKEASKGAVKEALVEDKLSYIKEEDKYLSFSIKPNDTCLLSSQFAEDVCTGKASIEDTDIRPWVAFVDQITPPKPGQASEIQGVLHVTYFYRMVDFANSREQQAFKQRLAKDMMMLQNKVPRARLGIGEASDEDEDDDELELEDEGEMAREVIFSNDVYKDIPAGAIISPCVVHALQPDQGLPIKPGAGKVVEPGFICRWFYDVHTKKLYKLDEALSDNSEVDEESRSKLQLLLQRTKDRMVESQLRDAAARDQQEGVDQETGADAAAGDQDALTDDDDDGQDDEAGPSNRRQRAARAKQQVASAGDADHGGDSVDAGQRRKKVVLPISDDEDE